MQKRFSWSLGSGADHSHARAQISVFERFFFGGSDPTLASGLHPRGDGKVT